MIENSMLRETKWMESRMKAWEEMGHVPQDDLERFCAKYVSAMILGAPDEVVKVQVILAYHGRTGILHVDELMCWDLCGRPDADQVTLLTDMMGREARRVAAKHRVQKVIFDLQLKSMHES